MTSEDSLTKTSPDGRVRIDFDPTEMRMSHWINRPTITDLTSGRVIVSLGDGMWDAEEQWGEAGTFALSVRHYPDGAYAKTFLFDLDAATVRVADEAVSHPICDAKRVIETHFYARPRIASPAEPSKAKTTPRDLVLGIAIALLLVAAIAAVTYWSTGGR